MDRLDTFVVISGTFSILTAIPLLYLAVLSAREGRGVRRIQYELAHLIRQTKDLGEEVHRLQREIRNEQVAARSGIDETRRTVEEVTAVVEHVSEAVEQVAVATVRRQRRVPLLLFVADDRERGGRADGSP